MRHPLSQHSTRSSFLKALRESRLLTSSQLIQIEADLADQPGSEDELAELFIERGWLTSYQVEQLYANRGKDLRLGQYRILEPIAGASQGYVYKAEHQLMRRKVALKVIRTTHEDDNDNSPMVLPVPSLVFLREVQATARLSHPNVVTAYDAGEDQGQLFLVMEYVEGIDLHHLVEEKGPLPVGLACELIRQAAEGLEFAHQQGMVHRDIKPGNMMVTLKPSLNHSQETSMRDLLIHHLDWPLPPDYCPQVKLLDLGLACMVSRATGKADEDQLVGTPDYLAPELAEQSPSADIRADIYSLGCSFYQLLTGEMPYPGGTWTEKIYRHRYDPLPAITEKRDDLPIEIVQLLERMLAKEPDDRPTSPKEIVKSLTNWLSENGSLDHQSTKPEITLSPAEEVRDAPISTRAILLAILIGLMLAAIAHPLILWLTSSSSSPKPLKIAQQRTPEISTPVSLHSFQLMNGKSTFSSLAEAIAAAKANEIIVIENATQPIPISEINWQTQNLTIRAKKGQRATLLFEPSKDAHPWVAMLTTNQSLTLINLDLMTKAASEGQAQPLLHCSGPHVHFENCTIHALNRTSPLIMSNVSTITLDNTQIHAATSAISLEVEKSKEYRLTWNGGKAKIEHQSGPLITIWASDIARDRTLEISLTKLSAKVGRLIAFSNLSNKTQVHTNISNSNIEYDQSLLSFLSKPNNHSWLTAFHWIEENTIMKGKNTRILYNGQPAPEIATQFFGHE